MAKLSAGVLMYRYRNRQLDVFLVHPGGPFWTKKDLGSWSIPKGEYEEGEEPQEAAAREFQEETGFTLNGPMRELGVVKQAGGKVISAWCFEGEADPAELVSNTFQMEWPPRSGHRMEFPEVDRGGWFSLPAAQERVLRGQAPFLDMLCRLLNYEEQV
ncbi:MAG: NUDIX domain-containing protein [Terracidiphilus sp.]|jgi:predicted NUDIX family NTP pyrophosphohydrolase